MSDGDTTNQVIEQNLITFEEQNGQPDEEFSINHIEVNYISGEGNNRINSEEEHTEENRESDIEDQPEDNQEGDIENNLEGDIEDNQESDEDNSESHSTISDNEEDNSSEDSDVTNSVKNLYNNNEINPENIRPYNLDPDQQVDPITLFVKTASSSEEPSPEKKDRYKEIILTKIGVPTSPLTGLNKDKQKEIIPLSISAPTYSQIEQEIVSSVFSASTSPLEEHQKLNTEKGKEIQIPDIATNLRIMTTTINLDSTAQDPFIGIIGTTSSAAMGSNGGNILGTTGGEGSYKCWVTGCNQSVKTESTKCDYCNRCEHEGCKNKAPHISRWCRDCSVRCKEPHCFNVGRVGGYNCQLHISNEPVSCAWVGCMNQAENGRGFCDECQDKQNAMCDTWGCNQPRCKSSNLYCQQCWETNMKKAVEEAKKGGTTTSKNSSKIIQPPQPDQVVEEDHYWHVS